jgi:subtilisin family serine protease
MRKLVVLAAGLALALPAPAAGARFALGVERGFSAERVADRVEAATGRPVTVIGPFAVAVEVPSARGLAAVSGVSYVERLRPQRRLAFVPNDPLVVRQWYSGRIRAFDAWPKLPILPRVLVAVIDSGIDADHPELDDRIAMGQSFVKSPWWWDSNGHGTFVAGQIAAEMNNGLGISGLAPPADLLIAKVVRSDGTISPEAEARAIRWAVDNGAGVINLSLGGTRDPYDSGRDTYSQLEAAAVEYAVKHGVLVVAAVGNGDKSPHAPWEYANYPAALPHVIGVSAIARDGSVPDFSNRDRVFNDIAAPGEDIFSTLPRALTQDRVGCVLQGYSECGPTEFRRGEGTSFAAPQVTAAAAILLGERPQMRPDQITAVLERSAADSNFARGCRRCTVGRDEFTGWGVLDITAAVNSLVLPAPHADQFEPNDGLATRAVKLWGKRQRRIAATLDYWNDQVDVYRVKLRRGQRVRAVLRGPPGVETTLLLWKPATKSLQEPRGDSRHLAARATEGSVKKVVHRAGKGGWYYLQVKLSTPTPTSVRYTLRFAKTKPLRPPVATRRPGRT